MIIIKFNCVPTTQEIAKKLAEHINEDVFAVIAEKQTNGRGRRGRRWHSPKGGLWMSIVLKRKNRRFNMAPLMAAVAVAKVIEKLYNLKVQVKWPNDILINGKKVGGILCEATFSGEELKYIVIGIGLNVNLRLNDFPRELRENATSILLETGREVNLETLAKHIIREIMKAVKMNNNEVLKKWKNYDCTLGRKVKVISDSGELLGVALAVDADGSLIVKMDTGKVKRIYADEVKLQLL
ncbi:MAG: biotin--[acetyl-CoA-carboxylase] ligase [archaeon GB-1867-005]|nr:biotin--[acetyl-CoA-carboxylase] ligase [Candidatus Culexmicrobium cathedralense]